MEEVRWDLTLFRVRVKHASSVSLDHCMYSYDWVTCLAKTEEEARKNAENYISDEWYLTDVDRFIEITAVEPVEGVMNVHSGDMRLVWVPSDQLSLIKSLFRDMKTMRVPTDKVFSVRQFLIDDM